MKIILGDNPFFGVNHLKGSKTLESQELRFVEAAKVVSSSVKHGVNLFMVSNHPTLNNLLDTIVSCEDRKQLPISLAFVIPYPHYFNDLVAENGYLGLLKEFLPRLRLNHFVSLTKSLFTWNMPYKTFCDLLIDSQIAAIAAYNKNITHICLHNIFVDMAISTNNKEFLDSFISCVKSRGKQAVLITQNYPSLLNMRCKGYTACFSLNKSGYMVNPNLSVVSDLVKRENQNEIWAMQILASGSDAPKDALIFLNELGIRNILYATTKKDRITDFCDTVQVNIQHRKNQGYKR